MTAALKSIRAISIGVYDGPHATPELHEQGAAVFLGIPNLLPDGRIDITSARWVADRDVPKWNRRVTPRAKDIVFTYEATLNRYAIIPEDFPCCLGRRTALIRTDPSKVDHRYLFYYFFSPRWRAQIEANVLTGATVDRIPLTKFPEFEVRVPELDEQLQIAGVLGTYDELIAINQRRMLLLEDAARRIYREWFVQLRFPDYEQTKPNSGSPEGWQLKKLGDLAPLNYGKSLKATERKPGTIPVFGSSGVVGTHNEALVGAGAIIVGRKGNVGSLYLSDSPCFPIDTVFFIDPKHVSRRLFLALHDLNFISSDAAVPGLNRAYAHSLPLVVPSDGLSEEFERVVAPLFEQLQGLKNQNKNLADARDLLLPKLMSGQLDVSNIVLPAENSPGELGALA